MTMKNNFSSVCIIFSVLSVKCVLGCFFKDGKLDCSSKNDSWKDVRAIPVIAPQRVEVFDLSNNPLSEGLKHNSFTYFRNVRELILRRDNLNSDAIEANAFSPLTKLTTLDLSENSLGQIPCSLPASLVHLDLGGNPISDETGCGFDCLSLPASLERLSLRGAKGRQKLPRFCDSAPSIAELDVSENTLDSVSVEELAPLCGLQRIHLTSVTISHPNGYCQKLQFEKWLQDHGIEMIGNIEAIYHDRNASCDSTSTSETMETYQDCRYKLYARKYCWPAIGGCILLLACIFLAILWWRKRKRSSKNLGLENSANVMVNIESRELDKTDAT